MTRTAPKRTREQWVETLKTLERKTLDSFRESVETEIEFGKALSRAKVELRGSFLAVVRENLQISEDRAEQLMRLSRNPRFAKSENFRSSPKGLSRLGVLAKLSDEDFDAAIADGRINPRTTAREAREIAVPVTDGEPLIRPVSIIVDPDVREYKPEALSLSMISMRDLWARLPPEFRARQLEERRRARQAAEAFVRVCKDGREDQLENAAAWLDEEVNAWSLALAKIARLPSVTPEIRNAFIPIWVEHKMLALRVGNRRVLATALRVLLPRNYGGPPLTLYRGTKGRRRTRRIHGFSWTTDIAVARKFAEHWAQPVPVEWQMSGVILKTVAPCEAVLLVRQPEDYYDEGEVVVDPFRLSKVEVVERLPAPAQTIGEPGLD